jgi:hypothetical protein
MLLSIDRVLQLLSEGKDIEKIASLSGVTASDVSEIISDARTLLQKHEKEKTRKKVVIRKKNAASGDDGRIYEGNDETVKPPFLEGVELAAMPLEEDLIINISAQEKDDMCGLAIFITDDNDRQLGKTNWFLRRISERKALARAASRAVEIAKYFKSRSLRIRSNDETFVKQISGEISVSDADIRKLFDAFRESISGISMPVKIEKVGYQQNEKAVFLAQRAIPQR